MDDDTDAPTNHSSLATATRTLINRNQEETVLKRHLQGTGPRHLFLTGPRGTGKTYLTRTVLNQLPDQFDIGRIACLTHDTQYKVLTALHDQLTDTDVSRGHHTSKLKDDFETHLAENQTILVLDELDFLLVNDGNDLLYYLSRLEHSHNLKTVCISANHTTLSDVLDDRTYSSLHPERIEFDRYTDQQVRSILSRHDLNALHDRSISPNVYSYIASQTSNIRLALHWLQYTANHTSSRLTEDDVQATQHEALQFYWDILLQDFSKHHHILIEAIDQLATENGGVATTGDIFDRYNELCEIGSNDPLSERRISDYLTHLELLNIIQADYHYGGPEGKTREITFTSPFSQDGG